MQGIFQKENTDKALKYGIYRHLPTYEKIIRNLVSFSIKKSIIRFISTLLVVMLLSESLSFVAFANDKSGGYVETHHQFNMEDINLSVENKNKLHISFDKSLNVLKNNKLNKEKKCLRSIWNVIQMFISNYCQWQIKM